MANSSTLGVVARSSLPQPLRLSAHSVSNAKQTLQARPSQGPGTSSRDELVRGGTNINQVRCSVRSYLRPPLNNSSSISRRSGPQTRLDSNPEQAPTLIAPLRYTTKMQEI